MVAFVRHAGRLRSAILIVNADGTGLRRVVGTEQVGQGIGGVVWSNDGTKLAFDRLADCDSPQRPSEVGLYVVNIDGSGLRKLPVLVPYAATLRNKPVSVSDYEWSSDGTRLLYVVHRYAGADEVCRGDHVGSSDLHSIGADGVGDTRLASSDWISNVQASPDEGSIAFTAYGDDQPFLGDTCSLFVRTADGHVARLVKLDDLLGGCVADNFSFTWSNDGSEIAYSDGQTNVEAVDVKTRQMRRVFTGEPPGKPCSTYEPPSCWLWILAMSRDGTRILVEQDVEEDQDWWSNLAIASFDGTSQLMLPWPASGRRGTYVNTLSAELP
jgi:Tol biopolymer transport system component